LMSIRTAKLLPLQLTVVPNSTAHVQIGMASSSRPTHATIHSLNGRARTPPGCDVPLAKRGVSASASTDAPECKCLKSALSTSIQREMAPAQIASIAVQVD